MMDEEKKGFDRITQLPNKRSFLLRLSELLDHQDLIKDEVLMYSNICNFSYCNIRYGGRAGNEVLRSLGESIRNLHPDLAGRYDNDHFVMVVAKNQCQEVLHELISEFNEINKPKGLSIKIGLFELQDGIDAGRSCELAKLACDEIRDSNEDYHFYDERMSKHAKMVGYLISNIDKAIEEGWIQVYYQPVVRTINDSLCSMEALARWIDPKKGMISPGVFIPVLENNQLITKLDLYVLEQVCRSFHEATLKNRKVIPVSINLSRADFLSCDIFQKVEDCVQKYHMARDYINIEVTESMVMEDSELLKRELNRFHEAGYEIWMDDFGSGYSSLNVLAEYEFDEIKLDRVFLRNYDDEKKKRIIRSVISMAKQLGIKTLTEGVETKQQYEFLKSIGCEKVQGYYFSAPVPLADLSQKFTLDQIETRLAKQYYSQVGKVNFMTERPFGIEDYDGHDFNLLYKNQKYIDIWKKAGVRSLADRDALLNDEHSPHYRQYRSLINKLEVADHPIHVELDAYGNMLTLGIQVLAKEHGHILLSIEAVDIVVNNHKNAISESYIYRALSLIYDGIYLIHRNTGALETVRPDVNYHQMIEKYKENGNTIDSKMYAELFIAQKEQREYEAFANLKTLPSRIAKLDRSFITQMFLTKMANGSYIYKLHTLQLVPDTDYVLYSIQNVPLLYRQIVDKGSEFIPDSHELIFEREVWRSFLRSNTINLFWKDVDRRFVGVNPKFLETYGLKDQKDVLGKTDEEMNWNIDSVGFRDDELDVIEHGIPVINHMGKCIIHSVVHNIVVNKYPVYHDGEIIGLVGSFVDLDDLPDYVNVANPSAQDSHLMNLQGITNAVSDYMESWEYRQEKFAAISIHFHAYNRAVATYGHKVARKMLGEMEDMIGKICANRAVASRFYGEHFLILYKYEKREEVNAFTKELSDILAAVHTLANYPETLNPDIEAYLVEDYQDVDAMMLKATDGVNISIREQKDIDEHLRDHNIHTEEIVATIPGGVSLGEVIDGQYQLNYASEALCATFGYSLPEFKNIINKDHDFRIIEEDRDYVNQVIANAFPKNDEFSANFRVKRKDGSVIWMHQDCRQISTRNSHPIFISIFQNLSEGDSTFFWLSNFSQEGTIVRDRKSKELLYVNHKIKSMYEKIGLYDSLDAFCDILFTSTHDGHSSEITYGDRYLTVHTMDGTWYGRESEVCFIEDYTLQHQQQESMREILSYVPAGIAMYSVSSDYEIRCLYLSEQAKKYGHVYYQSNESLDGLVSTVYPEEREHIREQIIEAVKKQELCDLEFRLIGDDGKIYWDRLVLSPYVQSDGTYLLYGVYSDVTELHEQKEALKKQSRTDALTQLLNRQALEDDQEDMIGHPLTLFMMDVDHFKQYNDQFGHSVGDLVIKTCGQLIQKHFEDCYNYRYGGDEFLIISTKEDLPEMKKRMDAFLKDIEDSNLGEGMPQIKISYGRLYGYPTDEDELTGLFKEVDLEMYKVKSQRQKKEH